MLVSVLSNFFGYDVSEGRIKQRLKNAILYAVSEGGKIFLSEAGTDLSKLCAEVIKEVSSKTFPLTHIPVHSDEVSERSNSSEIEYAQSPSKKLRAYLKGKADLIIILSTEDNIIARQLSKNTLYVKI